MLSLPDYPLRQREFLLEISRAITARLDLSDVLKRVLQASITMTAARVGIIALADAQDQFTVRAYAGFTAEHLPTLNAQLRDLIQQGHEAYNYDTVNAKLREMAESLDQGLVQSAAMPLIFAGRPLGLLMIFRSYFSNITPNDIQILQSFCDQAAIAVHNAQLYERINLERQRLAAILYNSGDGIFTLNRDLRIQQVNRAFEAMTGWRAAEAIGKTLDEVFTWKRHSHPDLAEALQGAWLPKASGSDEATSNSTHYVEGDLLRPDGLVLSIGITYAPLFSAEGHWVSLIANMRDVTQFRRAQEMQNVFISTVSHELRTPVALIKGYASTLNRTDVEWDAATLHQSLAVIEEEADRLSALIDDLLTASRIQAEQNVRLNLADVRLDLLAERIIERQQTQSTRHKFALSFEEAFPSIQGDAKLLQQVIENLVTNAIKYSPQGGTITIGGRFTRESVTLFVKDEGIGIPESEHQRIFDRFYRVDNSTTSKTKGTGLGLYLVKAIVEAHHGTLSVRSQLKHGSTFIVTLPRD